MKELVKIHKVLADESRLRVLNLFMESSCCVCEVMQVLDISQSKASRILTALHDTGILEVRREGLWAVYFIDGDTMRPVVKAIVEATTAAFAADPQMVADRERLKQAERVGPACARGMCRNRPEATRLEQPGQME